MPQRIPAQKQRAGAAPGPQLERRLDEAHPHHRRNYDVNALCERIQIIYFSMIYIYIYNL